MPRGAFSKNCASCDNNYAYFTCPCGHALVFTSPDKKRNDRRLKLGMKLHYKKCDKKAIKDMPHQNNKLKGATMTTSQLIESHGVFLGGVGKVCNGKKS